MSTRAEIFLGIIAVATLATAIVQIGVLVAAGLLARRLARLTDQVERELQPLFGHLNTIARDASRATALAVVQVERVDDLFADVAYRVGETLNVVQAAVAGPAREGAALLAGFRAILSALRNGRNTGPRTRGEDDDALFI